MNALHTAKELDESFLTSQITMIDKETIQYAKLGQGVLQTNRPLTSVRLELALDYSGLSQVELARMSNVTQPTISRIIKGKTEASKHITKIASALGISAEWLEGLEGEKINVKITDNTLRIGDQLFILVRMYSGTHNLNASGYKNSNRDLTTMIAASLIDRSIDPNDLSFIIEDDRANFPDIKAGASVTFNTNDTKVVNGDFYVIKHGDMSECVRMLYCEPNGDIRIKALQANFPEYIVDKNDEKFSVLGRVIFVTNVY